MGYTFKKYFSYLAFTSNCGIRHTTNLLCIFLNKLKFSDSLYFYVIDPTSLFCSCWRDSACSIAHFFSLRAKLDWDRDWWSWKASVFCFSPSFPSLFVSFCIRDCGVFFSYFRFLLSFLFFSCVVFCLFVLQFTLTEDGGLFVIWGSPPIFLPFLRILMLTKFKTAQCLGSLQGHFMYLDL